MRTTPPAVSTSSTPDAHELAQHFATPDARGFGPVPIWWWSGATLTRGRLRWQMEQLLSQGIAQAVIINLAPTGPLYGSLADDPPFMSEAWWEIFLGACEDAAELGFSFWPYDQIGFSGANLQGRLITRRPDWAGQALGRVQLELDGTAGRRIDAPLGAVPLAAYVVALDGATSTARPVDARGAEAGTGAGTLTLVYAQSRGFDYFNREAAEALIDTVHGEFARRAGHLFGTVIAGFFQDELPAMPTWSSGFASSFREQNGFALEPHFAALWDDPLPAGGTTVSPGDVRRAFHEHRTRLAKTATFDPLATWFDEHGLICGFDQQSPAREGDPAGATALYGNYLELHAGYGAPGSDHWGDSKVHSSLAHAGGHPRTWIESFHSSGWGGTLEETYDWLAPFFRRGATLYNPHAVYYSTVGGWWEWAPPSTCWRQPYWGQYHVLADSVARLSKLLTTGIHVADTILVFPTSTVQSGVTLEGPLESARRAGAIYHELNGTPAWYAERPGVLDLSGHDYDILDETVLADAVVESGMLVVGEERYRNVVVPGATVLGAEVSAVLAQFAEAGGRVIFVGGLPSGVEPSAVSVVDRAHEVPALLVADTVWVEADVPLLLRRIGDTWVIALFAHDEVSGTSQPIIRGGGSGIEWIETTWDAYWEEITEHGYDFRPVSGRVATVTVHGLADHPVQSWDPRSGQRQSVGLAEDGVPFPVGFSHGTVTVLVLGADLPEATEPVLAPAAGVVPIERWTLQARSLLDNRDGDFADRRRTGILPIEVWQFEHSDLPEGADPGSAESRAERQLVTATFGPFATATDPAVFETAEPWAEHLEPAAWHPVSWSLSRGIEQDPVHGDSLGPKGYVPEEFLAWPETEAGAWVAVRTRLEVPETDSAAVLAVGANARKHVVVDGVASRLDAEGYLGSIPILPGSHEVTIWLQAERTEKIRASFAIVTDLEHFRRPEWVEPVELASEPTTWELAIDVTVDDHPTDCRILVGSERPCTVFLNDVEIGRQSDFDPYADRRFGRLHPYDLGALLQRGANSLRLASLEGGRRPAVLVDSLPIDAGGLGIATGTGVWTSSRAGEAAPFRLRSQQWQDPRFVSIEARPHPLRRAAWLEEPATAPAAVLDIVPNEDAGDRSTQVLRFVLPIGATALEVPTPLAFHALLGDRRYDPVGTRVELESPSGPGTELVLVFERPRGRRAGNLLDAAVQVETAPAASALLDWLELGLGSVAGEVAYTATVTPPEREPGQRIVLDLGRVRGSAEVEIDGVSVGQLAWSPYRVDLTAALDSVPRGGEVEVTVRVRNTLAGYLDHASPTPGVFEGQRSAGLFGPVALTVHNVVGGLV